jgi:hypothetical protein
MANQNLTDAKRTKNDEFYTQFQDIEKEINAYLEFNPDVFHDKTLLLPCDDPEWSNFTKYFAQNFERLGLKKLVSTSYAPNSKRNDPNLQPTLFELESPEFDESKSLENGKLFVLERDTSGDGRIDVEDIEWRYLEGNGDFRSAEICALRDEADVIVTNPPFSLFREFVGWIFEAGKRFIVLGSINAVTYSDIFPLIRDGEMWLGATGYSTDMVFRVPEGSEVNATDREKAERLGYVGDFTRLGNSCWFSNIDHGRRHADLTLMTGDDNFRFSRHKEVRGVGYRSYDNYFAIEVPFIDAIPSDYPGVMGVPISFLDKHNPDQFKVVGMSANWMMPQELLVTGASRFDRPYLQGRRMYVRLFISPLKVSN